MIPAKFDYVRPTSLDEAVRALADGRRGRQGDRRAARACCRCCGCGWPTRSCWWTSAALDELRGVSDEGDSLLIGARTTHYQVVHDPLIAEHCGLLAEAAGTVADPAVRHRGTLGGSLAHADPAGDLPAVVAGAGRDDDRPGPRRRAGDRGRRTSSSTT